MLTTLEISNFKSLGNVRLNLDNSRLHALVGQNGSGKTSILTALDLLATWASHELTTSDVASNQISTAVQSMATREQGSIFIKAKLADGDREWEVSCQATQPLYQWHSQNANPHCGAKITYITSAIQSKLKTLWLDIPQIVLIENVEQGLHPKAQREFIEQFKNLVKSHWELIVFFSTHSPYILDGLTFSQVHVLALDKDGLTQTKRLDEHPEADWAKNVLTTGEFWDAHGEEWVCL